MTDEEDEDLGIERRVECDHEALAALPFGVAVGQAHIRDHLLLLALVVSNGDVPDSIAASAPRNLSRSSTWRWDMNCAEIGDDLSERSARGVLDLEGITKRFKRRPRQVDVPNEEGIGAKEPQTLINASIEVLALQRLLSAPRSSSRAKRRGGESVSNRRSLNWSSRA